MVKDKYRVLLIDDKKLDQIVFKRLVKEKNLPYDYTIIESIAETMEIIKSDRFDIIIVDYFLKDGTAFNILDSLINIPIIVVSDIFDEDIALNSIKKSAYYYMIKDIEQNYIKILPLIIEKAIRYKKSDNDLRVLYSSYMSISECVYISDMDNRIRFVNKSFCNIYGYTEDEIIGKSEKILWKQKSIYQDMSQIKDGSQKNCQGWDGEFFHRRKDGSYFKIHLSRSVARDKIGDIIAIIVVIHDINEKNSAEIELATEKERLAVTLRSIADGVITTDINGNIYLINRVAEEITGWRQEEVNDKSFNLVFNLVDDENKNRSENPFNKVIKSGINCSETQRELIDKNKNKRIISYNAAPINNNENKIIGVILIFRDITENLKVEKELQNSKKLDSIALLASGIAHDFNNILTSILGNISIAKMDVDENDELHEILSKAEKSSLKAKNLTKQLLVFSKGGSPVKETSSISELLRETIDFALRGSNLGCKLFIDDNLWTVNVDKGQIYHVINNLIMNVREAMPDGGSLEIQAQNLIIKKKNKLPLKEGKYIMLSIKDQGIGIANEHIQKIFDPYFTTKKEGSGLGLAVCYSIIKKHHGYITVESKEGEGTTFKIYLHASGIHNKDKKNIINNTLIHGTGKILVMDDDEFIRDVLGRMLKSLGYSVEFAMNGEEAIEKYKMAIKLGSPFDVTLMDLTIPGGMGGKEAIKRLIDIDPNIKGIASSGYSNDLVMAEFDKFGFKGVIAKPYKIAELSEMLHRVNKGGKD